MLSLEFNFLYLILLSISIYISLDEKHGVNAENPDDLLPFLLKVNAKTLMKDTSKLLYDLAANGKKWILQGLR